MHELAGPTDRPNRTYARYYQARYPDWPTRNLRLAQGYGGKYRTMPWAENRGPNPYLMTRTLVAAAPGTERRDVVRPVPHLPGART